jgi:plastocyanin
MTAARALPPTLAVIAVLAGGCGNSSSSSGGGTMAAQANTPASGSGAAQAPAAGAAVQSATVDIAAFKFKPVTIVVKKGGHVRWTNSDAAAHTATADDRSFDTQTIDKGSAKAITLTKAGTFSYHCDFHPFMKATVVVK